MYKFLPILLFAFLVAEENQEPHFIQSDSLDFIWAEDKIDYFIKEFYEKIENFINKDKFQIKVDKEVYDVMRIDTLYSDIVSAKQSELHEQYPNEKLASMSILSEEDLQHWRIAIFKINIQVNVDKTIGGKGFIKKTIKNIIEDGFIWGENSEIKLDFVDISTLKHNNNQLSLNRDDIYDDSWAVIIGIDKYKYSDQLNYAVKDAEAVKEMLINKFAYPEENIRYLTDEQATLSEIKVALGEVATLSGENDRILVFYSGHGETFSNKDGTETGYIIPIEGKQDQPYETGLAMDDILRTCKMSDAKHMLFLMDACYSGLMTEKARGLAKPQREGYLSKVANEKARQIITAGGGNEEVIERDEWQHSAFTKNLLVGLDDWDADTDNDGYITADELGTYLRKSVTEDSDFQQTPQKGRFRNSGGGEFVFFSNHKAIKPKLVDQTAQSNGDDIAAEKAVDMKKSWHEKYGHEGHGMGLLVLEDIFQIGYTRDLNENWLIIFGYAHIGNNLIQKVIPTETSHTLTADNYIIALNRQYFLSDNMWSIFGVGASYMTVSWEDKERNVSSDFNEIVPALSCGMGASPFQFDSPFPMSLGVSFFIHAHLLPTSYSETDMIITLDDWEIKLFPGFLFHFDFPK